MNRMKFAAALLLALSAHPIWAEHFDVGCMTR